MKRSHIVLLTAILLCLFTLAACQTDSQDAQDTTAAHTQNVAEITETTEPAETTAAITTPAPTELTEEQKALIDGSLDILAAFEPTDPFMQSDIIDANPEAFRAITDLGSAAIPYLTEIWEDPNSGFDNSDQFRRIAAFFAAYDIDPSRYDLSFSSTDGIHELHMSVGLFYDIPGQIRDGNEYFGYSDLCIVNTETGAEIAYTPLSCRQPTVEWAPDGQSAAISSHGPASYVIYLSRFGGFQYPNGALIESIEQLAGTTIHSNSQNQEILKWDEDGSLYFVLNEQCGDAYATDTIKVTCSCTPQGSVSVLDYEITPRQIQPEEIDYCLSNIPGAFLYDYENDLSDSHELGLLIAMGDAAIPHLLAIAEETRRYDSPGYDHKTFVNALFAIGIIDPGAYADLPIADYLIPSEDGSYVYFDQEDLLFDCVNRRILCCRYLPFGDALMTKYGISVNQNVTETEFLSWESENVIRLGFYAASNEPDIGRIMGECTYDFSIDTMLSQTHTTEFEPNLGPVPYDDISRTVSEQLDILMNVPNAYSAKDYIDVHPEAYDAIVSLGDAALPYLKQIVDETPRRMLYRIRMAQTLAHAIDPDLYDTVSISPDGTVQLAIDADDFFYTSAETGIFYKDVMLTDAASGEVLANAETELICHPDISWSPDSRYAVINHGHLKYGGGTPIVIDTEKKTISPVSGILDAVAAACGIESVELYSIFTKTMPWESDGIRISFHIKTHAASTPGMIDGHCSVDSSTGEITETVITYYEPPQILQ